MASHALYITTVCSVLTRTALERMRLRVHMHRATPGRLVSLLHGIFCSMLLFGGAPAGTEMAVKLSAAYFVKDFVCNAVFNPSDVWRVDSVLHHTVGFFLCAGSALYKTYDTSHPGFAITRALVAMETTNVTFQAILVLKNENIAYPRIMDVLAVLHWATLRILNLGMAVFATQVEVFYSHTALYCAAIAMFGLQGMWLLVILAKLCPENKTEWSRQQSAR